MNITYSSKMIDKGFKSDNTKLFKNYFNGYL